MCEVTNKNFNRILPELKNNIENAKFIALDTEFSCLTASQDLQNSIFDSPQKRYSKLRKHMEQIIPVQIGVTAFIFDPDRNFYKGHSYTFYVFPRPFGVLDRKFLCQASSLTFLNAHNFDFNKFVGEGISYINRTQEREIQLSLEDSLINNSDFSTEQDTALQKYAKTMYNWIGVAKNDEVLSLTDYHLIKNDLEFKYFLHRHLRNQFKNVWTYDNGDGFTVKKLSSDAYENLRKGESLEKELLTELLGFTQVFRCIQSSQKPVIGHNLLLDLILITHYLDNPLPNSYSNFKKTIHGLFPEIFDTKCLSFDILNLILEKNRCRNSSLEDLYNYFKDGKGRHLVSDSPLIEPQSNSLRHFHSAGWDSFCTGYVFIRMAHFYAVSKNRLKSKTFMNKELLNAVSGFKNQVNIIRGEVSHIQLDGDDPPSRRPPWLIVEGTKNQLVDVNEISTLLGNYGFVEVKPYSYKGKRALIAVDNFGNAKRILRNFQSHSDYKIQPYNFLKHSPVANACVWSGIILSATFLAWYGYLKMR